MVLRARVPESLLRNCPFTWCISAADSVRRVHRSADCEIFSCHGPWNLWEVQQVLTSWPPAVESSIAVEDAVENSTRPLSRFVSRLL